VKPRSQDILGAAARLLAAHGYYGLSMRELARETGMSLANLYNYFPSKEELVFALQTRAFEALIASAEQSLAGVEGPDQRLYTFILSHVRYVTANRDVTRVLVEEAGELPPKRRRTVRDLKERYFRMAQEIVVSLQEAGCRQPGAVALGPQTAAECERSTYSIFGMLNWVYGWYDAKRHGSVQDVARSIYRIALCGLVARCPSTAMLADVERHVRRFDVLSPIVTAEA
jgi:AcrR family transcriptional regulator